MSEAEARMARAIAAIDAANAGDPNRLEVRGATRPKELAHAELASADRIDKQRSDAFVFPASFSDAHRMMCGTRVEPLHGPKTKPSATVVFVTVGDWRRGRNEVAIASS